MGKQTPAPQSYGIDLAKFLDPRDTSPLPGLDSRERVLVVDCILRDLVEHPLRDRHPISGALLVGDLVHEIWGRVRAEVVDVEGKRNFEELLRSDLRIAGPLTVIENLIRLLYHEHVKSEEFDERARLRAAIPAQAFATSQKVA